MSDYLSKRRQWSQFGKPKEEKPVYRMRTKSLKKLAEEKAAKESGTDASLDVWFITGMEKNEAVCRECGMRADWLKDPQYEIIWRASQAHILPKKKRYGFPSIATHPDNRLILFPSWGGHLCGCHGFYDSSWYNASTMKIWPIVVEIVTVKLYPILTTDEKKRIPEIFLPFLKKEIK